MLSLTADAPETEMKQVYVLLYASRGTDAAGSLDTCQSQRHKPYQRTWSKNGHIKICNGGMMPTQTAVLTETGGGLKQLASYSRATALTASPKWHSETSDAININLKNPIN